MFFNILTCLASLNWLGVGLGLFSNRKFQLNLKTFNQPAPATAPLVSIVTPVRNDAAHIKRTLELLDQQDYPNLEIVAVNDRSNDDTPQILSEMASTKPKMKVVNIDHLPKGWLGKCNAVHQGIRRSNGEFVLLMDSDVILSPKAIRRAVNLMTATQADHLVVEPFHLSESFIEESIIANFFLIVRSATKVWTINQGRTKKGFAGYGTFSFLRRKVFEKIGGMEPLRLEIVDDTGLGYLVRKENFRQKIARGDEDVFVRYQEGVTGLFWGSQKNAFAGAGYSLLRMSIQIFLVYTFGIHPFLAAFGTSIFSWVFALNLISLMSIFYLHWSWSPWARWYGFLFLPLACLHYIITVTFSALTCLREGGVRWRNDFYPLRELKAHLVHPRSP